MGAVNLKAETNNFKLGKVSKQSGNAIRLSANEGMNSI